MQQFTQRNVDENQVLMSILNRINASRSITSFDRSVYTDAYGSDAVTFVEATCEDMVDTNNPNNRIGAMLNISYDKGFDDCCQMILNILKEWGVHVE